MEIISEDQINIENQFKINSQHYEVTEEEAMGHQIMAAKVNSMYLEFLEQTFGIPQNSGYRCIVSGSTAMGTNVKGSDIDICALLPPEMSVKDFYGDFYKAIKAKFQPGSYSKKQNFTVHILKFEIDGRKVDIIGAFIQEPLMPTSMKNILRCSPSMRDHKSFLAFKALKTREALTNMFGSKLEVLTQAIKFLKMWTKGEFNQISFFFC